MLSVSSLTAEPILDVAQDQSSAHVGSIKARDTFVLTIIGGLKKMFNDKSMIGFLG
jgi:hypothetical protein